MKLFMIDFINTITNTCNIRGCIRLTPLSFCSSPTSPIVAELLPYSLEALDLTDSTYCDGVISVTFLKCLEK